MNKVANRFRLLKDYLGGVPSLSGMPAALCVDVTNRCNMSCIMCPREKLDSHPEDMSLEFLKRIADEARSHVEFLDFSFRGESLLNENIFQMIEYAKKLGMRTSLQTNGMLLSEENCTALINSGLDLLSVSIDAVSPETHGKIRRGGDFHCVIENVKHMINLNNQKNHPLMIVVQMIRMEENISELKNFKAYWKRQSHVFPKTVPFSNRAGLVSNNVLSVGKGRPVRCSRIWKCMYICSNGIVVPCCNDFLCRQPLGDLNSQSIKEVWNGAVFVDLRRRHCAEEFSLTSICKDCEFLRMDFYKQLATFVFDDLSVRKLLATFDLMY